jgi:hypothetical protein
VDLLVQAVEDAHGIAAAQQLAGDRTSNEAGAAGHEDGFPQRVPP